MSSEIALRLWGLSVNSEDVSRALEVALASDCGDCGVVRLQLVPDVIIAVY